MIKLGCKVKDVVTGFTGVAVARYQFINGCDRYCVAPKSVDGKTLLEESTFDEPQLKILSQPSPLVQKVLDNNLNMKKKPGGPAPFTPHKKVEVGRK